jgi:hypothetical protein
MSALMLSTAFALVLLAGYFAFVAFQSARSAGDHAQRLVESRGRIVALEHALESLDAKHRKLAGRVYATEPQVKPEPVVENEIEGEPCANWLKAKVDGPRSRAANCECGYCVMAREIREEFRAKAVPKRARVAATNGSGG